MPTAIVFSSAKLNVFDTISNLYQMHVVSTSHSVKLGCRKRLAGGSLSMFINGTPIELVTGITNNGSFTMNALNF